MRTWIIMGILLVAVFGFLGFTSLRDRRKSKQSRLEHNTETTDANIKKDELMMELSAIVKLNAKDLADFKPAGGKPMRQIVDKSKILVKNLKTTKSFAAAITLEVNELELSEIFKELLGCRSNHWDKKCSDIIKIVNSHVETFIEENNDNKEQYLLILKKYRKIWDEIKL